MERKEQVRQGQPGSVQRQRQSKRLVTIKTHITYHLTIETNNHNIHCDPCDEGQYSQFLFLAMFFRVYAVVYKQLFKSQRSQVNICIITGSNLKLKAYVPL